MNERSIEPIAAVARQPRAAPSAADVERGVNLFILAAASFLRSAAAERARRRPRPKRSANGPKPAPRRPPKPQ